MKLHFQMNLEQTQKLVMTPELRHAIEILQYNALELHQHIQTELLENPVLEILEKTEALDDIQEVSSERVQVDWQEVAKQMSMDRNRGSGYNYYEDQEDLTFENTVAQEESLQEHLLFQLQFTVLSPKEYKLGQYLIHNINSAGYLNIDTEYIVSLFKVDEDVLEEVIQTIQTFDPYGVGARDVAECLLIQVQMKEIDNPTVIEVINSHLDALANNRIKEIAKEMNIPCSHIQEAVDIIKSFDPKPGLKYASLKDVKYIVPDVEVKCHGGEYIILVSDASAPKLNISTYYRQLLLKNVITPTTIEYINQKMSSALWLIKSIEQRRQTIYKVVEAILRHQSDFFEKGTMFLKTLNLKDIAEDIGVHESTVSRAVNGKYMQCSRGVYELKYFFQSGVSSAYGDGISAETIKQIIKELVEDENPKKPISDQHMVGKINGIGVKISRRTVAKYRESMGIPGSSKRKRY